MLANSSSRQRTCTGSLPPYTSSALSHSRLNICVYIMATMKLNVSLVSDMMTNSADLLSPNDFRGRGLTARFLYSIPTSTVGERVFESRPIPDDVARQYEGLIKTLLGINEKQVLRLSAEAYGLSKGFFEMLEPRLRGDLEPVADWASKLHGAVLRIAGVIHTIVNGAESGNVDITGDTMQRAITIGLYIWSMHRARTG